jgi:hypothetical protein
MKHESSKCKHIDFTFEQEEKKVFYLATLIVAEQEFIFLFSKTK